MSSATATATECFHCDPNGWFLARDDICYFDHYTIERFYRLQARDINTLTELVEILQLFQQMTQNIAESLEGHHKRHCRQCCGSCKQTLPSGQTTILGPDAFKEAVAYYTGLSADHYSSLKRLSSCIPEIIAIRDMIGMESIKSRFLQLLKYLATTDNARIIEYGFMMHMVISGPPGHGKTEIAKLIGKALRKSGLLSSDNFVQATRADLIGAYCGHTAKNTTKMFDKAVGGVIFIDEIYSLGNPEQRDVFTKECIDTINLLLSERTDTLCIIAGYEEQIETCFFAYNEGLQRRFPWRFTIKPYTAGDLVRIFNKMLGDRGWTPASPDVLKDTDIDHNKQCFANAGGDIVNLVSKCIIAHHNNAFLRHTKPNTISREDVVKGIADMIQCAKTTKKTEPPMGMYT